MKRIAISSDGGKTCHLWCEVDKTVKGRIYFTVINGAWQGSIKDNLVTVGRRNEDDEVSLIPGQICWTGKIPKKYDTGYNTTITWINEQLTKVKK